MPPYTPMAPFVAQPAPITPSAQQLYNMNMSQLQPALQQQASQYQQAEQLLRMQMELERQRQEMANQQFMYATPSWQQRQAAAYTAQQFPGPSPDLTDARLAAARPVGASPGVDIRTPRYMSTDPRINAQATGPQGDLAAFLVNRAHGRRHPGYVPDYGYGGNGGQGLYRGTGGGGYMAAAGSPALGTIAQPDTAWTPPVSPEQAIADQQAAAGPGMALATAPFGYMPSSQGTMYAGTVEGFAGTPNYPADSGD